MPSAVRKKTVVGRLDVVDSVIGNDTSTLMPAAVTAALPTDTVGGASALATVSVLAVAVPNAAPPVGADSVSTSVRPTSNLPSSSKATVMLAVAWPSAKLRLPAANW